MSNSAQLVVVAGPHGAGKDTLADEASVQIPGLQRIRRLTTRQVSAAEQASGHYAAVSEDEFSHLEASGALVVTRHYAEASTAILSRDLDFLDGERLLTCNFEEGQAVVQRGRELARSVVSIFVSPVGEESLRASADEYLLELRRRMTLRARATDAIDARLEVATRYRADLLAGGVNGWVVVENRRDRQEEAVESLLRAIRATSVD